MRSVYKITLFLAIAGMLWSCDDDTSNPIPPTGNMVLNMENLNALPGGWRYEAWLTIGTEVFSAGRFQGTEDGSITNLTMPVQSDKLESADGFFVTIESTTDNDPTPTGARLLAGTFSQYEAVLRHDGESAMGADLSDPDNYSGRYLIAAPTTAATEDDTSGIWFIDNSGGSAEPGLILPALSTGWVYEGWVIIDGQPVSTGRFTDPAGPDASCTYCGPMAAPAFPGEDFIMSPPAGLSFPTSLAGRMAVISVEPEPDYDEGPFAVKILSALIATNTAIGLSYNMSDLEADVPSGSVVRFYDFNCTNDGCQ